MQEGYTYLTANGSLSSSDIISIAALAFSVLTFVISQVISACRVKTEKAVSNARYEEQRKQYEERLDEERKRREEDRRDMEERSRISEEPYLVFKKSRIVSPSASEQVIIRLEFLNKGRGSAYEIIPDDECKAKTADMEEIQLYRFEAVEDPIATVGELFIMNWTYESAKKLCFRMEPSIMFRDASGRRYKQTYCIDIIDGNGTAIVLNYAQPELCEK